MSLRIWLVEDDPELRRTLREVIEVEGYQVITSASLADARAVLTHSGGQIDLVLLDLGLPDGEGQTLLEWLRREQSKPVIVLSARDGEQQKICLLDAGADDYLVKPFSTGELLARIRVALRHRGQHLQAAITGYRQAGLELDLAAHRISLNGQPVHLTPTEFRLLARLARSAGRVVTHRQLLADVWGPSFVEHTHYLRLYMGQLRTKLETDPADPRRLMTELGVGYRLAEPDSTF